MELLLFSWWPSCLCTYSKLCIWRVLLPNAYKLWILFFFSQSNPHPLVWAKLKGFPFWPAKALRDKDGQVDARFFGQHDRWESKPAANVQL